MSGHIGAFTVSVRANTGRTVLSPIAVVRRRHRPNPDSPVSAKLFNVLHEAPPRRGVPRASQQQMCSCVLAYRLQPACCQCRLGSPAKGPSICPLPPRTAPMTGTHEPPNTHARVIETLVGHYGSKRKFG